MRKVSVATDSLVDYWNNGDGTVSLVVTDTNGKEVELTFNSSSPLGKLSSAADKARDYIKLVKRPPMIHGR